MKRLWQRLFPSQDGVDDGHWQPEPGAVGEEAVAAELRPDDARVEGVRGHPAAVEPLAQLLGEEDVGQLEQ